MTGLLQHSFDHYAGAWTRETGGWGSEQSFSLVSEDVPCAIMPGSSDTVEVAGAKVLRVLYHIYSMYRDANRGDKLVLSNGHTAIVESNDPWVEMGGIAGYSDYTAYAYPDGSITA